MFAHGTPAFGFGHRKSAELPWIVEGTRSQLEDVLEYELDQKEEGRPADIGEVVGYVKAMNEGLDRLGELSLGTLLTGRSTPR